MKRTQTTKSVSTKRPIDDSNDEDMFELSKMMSPRSKKKLSHLVNENEV